MGATSSWTAPPGWRKLRLQVFAVKGRSCYRCGAYADTVDHIVAVALGGTHALSNLRPACSHHNYSAGASMGNRLRPRTQRIRPRRRGQRQAVKAARIPPAAVPGPMRTSRNW